MRICIVSDTHRRRHELLAAVKSLQPLDGVLHAGDETADAKWLAERVRWPVLGVAGNWDRASVESPIERLVDQFGPRILLTHGHTIHVKDGYQQLLHRARVVNATIAIYGHTHVAFAGVEDGILILNPGSISEPRGGREKTLALLEITHHDQDDGLFHIRLSHRTLAGSILTQLNAVIPGSCD